MKRLLVLMMCAMLAVPSVGMNVQAASLSANAIEKEKADMMTEIMNLKQELRNSKLSVQVASNSNNYGEVNNIDIMRRLSNLEKMVYNSKSSSENEKDDNDE